MEVIRLTLLTQSPSCDSTKKEHWLEVTGCQHDTDIIDQVGQFSTKYFTFHVNDMLTDFVTFII